jgi:hypothetical protein
MELSGEIQAPLRGDLPPRFILRSPTIASAVEILLHSLEGIPITDSPACDELEL